MDRLTAQKGGVMEEISLPVEVVFDPRLSAAPCDVVKGYWDTVAMVLRAATKTGVASVQAKEVPMSKELTGLGLAEESSGRIAIPWVTHAMEKRRTKSEKRRAAAAVRWGKSPKNAFAMQMQCKCNANASAPIENTGENAANPEFAMDANAMQMQCKCNANAMQMHPRQEKAPENSDTCELGARVEVAESTESQKKSGYMFRLNLSNNREEVHRTKEVTLQPSSLLSTYILENAKSVPKGPDEEKFSSGFLNFWKIYPVKKAKRAAWRAWQRLKCEKISAEVIEKVEVLLREDSGWREGYIPYPATWLNAGGWDDTPRRERRRAISQTERVILESRELALKMRGFASRDAFDRGPMGGTREG